MLCFLYAKDLESKHCLALTTADKGRAETPTDTAWSIRWVEERCCCTIWLCQYFWYHSYHKHLISALNTRGTQTYTHTHTSPSYGTQIQPAASIFFYPVSFSFATPSWNRSNGCTGMSNFWDDQNIKRNHNLCFHKLSWLAVGLTSLEKKEIVPYTEALKPPGTLFPP